MLRQFIFMLTVMLLLFNVAVTTAHAKDSEKTKPDIQSEAAILMDAATGEVLYQKNGYRKMYPASITKILTAIIAIKEGNLEDTVTVSEKARNVEGTRVYLLEGEQVSLLKLIQGMMINSGNDAAIAIAEHLSGSVEQFAEKMNAFAREEIGVTDSHFVNPHGLFDENHYTTAYDMAMITKYAMKSEVFREIVSTKKLKWNGKGWDTTLYNHNRMLWRYKGANGVKNGWVTKSGFTLVSSADRKDMELIAVTLDGRTWNSIYEDAENLLDYGFNSFQRNVVPEGKTFKRNGETYVAADQIRYTQKIGEHVSVEIDEAGSLVIKGEDGRLIEKRRIVNVTAERNKKIKQTNNNEDGGLKKVLFSILEVVAHSANYIPNIWVAEDSVK